MNIAILGLGNMGQGLAQRLAGKVNLTLGSRDTAKAQAFASTLSGDVKVADYDAAAKAADIIVLALPYGAALAEAKRNNALAGKIVVDISNPVNAEFSGLSLGFDTSAAESIQAAVPAAKVVKAYNTIFAGLFSKPVAATSKVPVFVAGNDKAAVESVTKLVLLSGFAVEGSGDLGGARLLEPLGMLNIRLGFGLGRGGDIAPAWLNVAS